MFYIGTDEAGYGPLLGPLVIAATLFESDAPREELSVSGAADSKIVYTRRGRAGLARVLGACFDTATPRTLGALLQRHSVRGDPRAAYPWYGDVSDDVAAAIERPRALRSVHFNPVCEGEFNAACARDGSKGTVLFRETMRVLQAALADVPAGAEVDVMCDKHGGRNRYAELLMAELGPTNLMTVRESRKESAYRIEAGGRRIRVRFVAKADAGDSAVALASMAAKYVRELFMEAFNSYFTERQTGLRPTAGYAVDGRRFLVDVAPLLEDLGIDTDSLVRQR